MSQNTSRKLNARRAQLQLLAPLARPARPPFVPTRRLPRRPGERREPLSVSVSPALANAAAERQLDPRCAAELCLERALVIDDFAAIGRSQLYERVLALTATVRVSRSLPAAKVRYLQMLLAARERKSVVLGTADGADDGGLDVPLRLFPRITTVVDELASAGADELAEALALEIAAVSDGRTMSEWVILAALRLSP